MGEYKIHYNKDSVVISHLTSRPQHFCFRIHHQSMAKQRDLRRLKYNLRRNPNMSIDRIYYLGKKYEIYPVSIQNPLHVKQERYNKNKVMY